MRRMTRSRFSTRLVLAAVATLTTLSASGGCWAFTTTPPVSTVLRAPPSSSLAATTIQAGRTSASVVWAGTANNHDNDDDDDNDEVNDVRFNQLAPPSRPSTDPTPVLVSTIRDFLAGGWNDSPKLGTTNVLAVAALALVLSFAPLSADAAMSGGRMGGSFTAPRSSSMSGGGGSVSRGYSSGFSSGYYSRPSITVAPVLPIAPPYYYGGGGVSPFGFGLPRPYFFGGPGVVSYSRGPSLFDLLFIGGIGFVVLNAFRSAAQGAMESTSTSFWSDATPSALGPGTAVVQMSVALQVPNRDDRNSILSVLDRLAQTARTDSRVGLTNLSSQVAVELLRRKSSIVSASTRYKHFNSRESAQREFNNVSVRERAKFEQETVSKYGGVDYSVRQRSSSGSGSTAAGDGATMAVVTLIFAVDGDATKVPNINSMQDVEAALSLLASNAKVDDCLQAAEILWTPEDRSETLTLRDVVADYPELRSV